TVAAMDILFPGIGEIVGGSQREERMDKLTQRMDELGISQEELWWYLDTRRFGSAPHAGFGLGFERMVQFVTGMGNVRDVIAFPRTPGNAEFYSRVAPACYNIDWRNLTQIPLRILVYLSKGNGKIFKVFEDGGYRRADHPLFIGRLTLVWRFCQIGPFWRKPLFFSPICFYSKLRDRQCYWTYLPFQSSFARNYRWCARINIYFSPANILSGVGKE